MFLKHFLFNVNIGQWFAGVAHETEETSTPGLNMEDSAVAIEGKTIPISHYHFNLMKRELHCALF